MSNNVNKAAIIAGNAPSLAEIDYFRLPKDFDVFRCNQFYFEDKYYLGKNIAYAFLTPPMLLEQGYTFKTLHFKKEYNITNIAMSDFNFAHMDNRYLEHKELFCDIMRGSSTLENLKEFYNFMRYNELYCNKRITSGIYMCAFAVALGYKEIYIAGIDLYSTNKTYAFDGATANILQLFPDFKEGKDDFHTPDTDLEALAFLTSCYNVRFYCLCPNSPITQYIPLADSMQDKKCGSTILPIQNKPKDYISDILIPSNEAYNKTEYPNTHHINSNKQFLQNNMLYKFFKDLAKLPRDIGRYFRK